MDTRVSDVGVLDKAMLVVGRAAQGPATLADIVATTGLARATAYRLAVALEAHGLLRRDGDGRFGLGLQLVALGRAAERSFPLRMLARPALVWLQAQTGESVQLYVRDGDGRLCVDAIDAPHELRTIVPVGAVLPLDRGSAGSVLGDGPAVGAGDWVASVAEREAGVASVSAAVRDPVGDVVAAVSVSGPIARLTGEPGPLSDPEWS